MNTNRNFNTKKYTLNGTEYVFDADTGAVVSLNVPGVKPIMDNGCGLFDIAWPVHYDYEIQRANPTANYGKCAPEFSFDGETLEITYSKVPYTMPCDDMPEYEGGISAKLTLKALPDGKSVSMRLQLKNNSGADIEQVLFPDMNGIVPTDCEENDRLTFMGGVMKPFVKLKDSPQARESFFAWSEATRGCFYTAGGFQNVTFIGRWYDMGSRKGGFSMYRRHWGWGPESMDRMGENEELWVKLNNKTNRLRLASVHNVTVAAGGEYDSGEYIITPHRGDWIRGIEPYRQYVLENQKRVVPVPKKTREMLGIRTIFMSNGYTKHPEDYSWKYDDFETIGADMKEHGIYDLCVWGEADMKLPFGRDNFYKEWGGFESYKKNVAKLREKGVTTISLVSWISAWDQTAEFLGIKERTGTWAETPFAIPLFRAPYCKRWACYEMHDHTNEVWKEEIRKGLRFLRDECGTPDIFWDQYILGNNADNSIHDIINEYRLETEKLYPGTPFCAEGTLYFESEVDNVDFHWNWQYWDWSDERDYRPYLHVIRTCRPNINVDSTPKYVRLICMDNLMLNVYPSHTDEYNGGALISEYPEFSEAIKNCASIRKEYLSYFVDGIMVSDCPLREDSDCRVTGYLKEDENKLLLMVFKNEGGESSVKLDFADFMNGDSFKYIIKDESLNTVLEGTVASSGDIIFSGESEKLYVIEIL